MTNESFRKVKNLAINFLETPIEVRKLPLNSGEAIDLVVHPFFSNRLVYFAEDTEQPFHDILSNDASLQKAIRHYKGLIEKSESIDSIVLLLNGPYRLQFLNIIQQGLSPDEMGKLLANVWVDNERPNNDVIPLSTIIKWFKKASRQSLMDAEELAYYDSLCRMPVKQRWKNTRNTMTQSGNSSKKSSQNLHGIWSLLVFCMIYILRGIKEISLAAVLAARLLS